MDTTESTSSGTVSSCRRRQCSFSNCAQEAVHIIPDDNIRDDFEVLTCVDNDTQCGCDMSLHKVNTTSCATKSTGMNHTEGGWPEDINFTENEQVARYLKKVEKDEAFTRTVQRLGAVMEGFIMQNNAIDIYENYFGNDCSNPLHMEANVVNVFRLSNDKQEIPVADICWCPDKGSKFVVANSEDSYLHWDPCAFKNCHIWTIENSNRPEVVLSAPSPPVCIEYNPKEPNVIASGCKNGQIGCWDIRSGVSFTMSDFVCQDTQEATSVVDVKWLSSKMASELLSVTENCTMQWWDMRKLEKPVDTFRLDDNSLVKGADQGIRCSCLEYEPSVSSKFMVGLDDGRVLCCKKSKSGEHAVTGICTSNVGAVSTIQRNPFCLKYFLTCANWAVKVWCEDFPDSPVISLRVSCGHVTDACWSPSRPAILLTVDTSGSLKIWNILASHDQPIYSLQVCNEPLACVKSQYGGALVACGSQFGITYLVRLSPHFTTLEIGEKSRFIHLMEQELKCEKLLLDEKKSKERDKGLLTANSASNVNEDEENAIGRVENEFWNEVNRTEGIINRSEDE